ncbi:NAD(P)-binding domain-containing protein, partial [Rhizobium johnstonii]|uniref:NAD(P)-binding domain-containing protein n=1 Tax=Rhizobium johnstonii TaxID=3019933 RepID=UPI003F9BC66B
LLVGRRLADRDQRFELFDENARVGDSWRARYRSLRLFSARRFASLPGLRIDIGRFEYPTGMQLADYLERYAQHFQLPVRSGVRVVRLVRVDGRFRLDLTDGSDVLADRVVVTAGAHRIPVTPAWAGELDPGIRQLHSIDYRDPEQLAE